MVDTHSVLQINDLSFEKVTAQGTTLVDFWAEWCMPCRMQGPILEEVAKEVGEKAVISKLNVDENQASAARFNVYSIPTLILFKDGQPVKQFVGVQSKETLIDAINKA